MSRTYTVPNPGQAHLVVAVTALPSSIAALVGAPLEPNNVGVVVQAEGGRIRFNFGGLPPMAGRSGFLLEPGDMAELSSAEATAALWVAEAGAPSLQIGGYSS